MAFDLAGPLRNVFNAHFSEEVIYKPRAGGERVIQAVVNRAPPQIVPESGGLTPHAIVEVDNDDETGISAQEIDTGGDVISMPWREGETPSDRHVGPVVGQDAGRLMLEVR